MAAIGGCTRRAVIASKAFTESVILGDIATQLAQSEGQDVIHKRQLGGTRIVWDALLKGQVDAYPEYTGTLTQEIFAGQDLRDEAGLRQALAKKGIEMTRSLGFSDSYALGMREDAADRLHVRTISDLRDHPEAAARPKQRIPRPWRRLAGTAHAHTNCRSSTSPVSIMIWPIARSRQDRSMSLICIRPMRRSPINICACFRTTFIISLTIRLCFSTVQTFRSERLA